MHELLKDSVYPKTLYTNVQYICSRVKVYYPVIYDYNLLYMFLTKWSKAALLV